MKAFHAMFLGAFLALVTPGCGFKQGAEDSAKIRKDVKSELGVDSFVRFTTFANSSGKHTTVEVRLANMPPGDAAAVKEQVTEIVRRDFHGQVDKVVVSF